MFTLGPIDLEFRPGEITFLVGGNGSGKTTLAKLLVGLYPPEEGQIILQRRGGGRRRIGIITGSCFRRFFPIFIFLIVCLKRAALIWTAKAIACWPNCISEQGKGQGWRFHYACVVTRAAQAPGARGSISREQAILHV